MSWKAGGYLPSHKSPMPGDEWPSLTATSEPSEPSKPMFNSPQDFLDLMAKKREEKERQLAEEAGMLYDPPEPEPNAGGDDSWF